MTCTRQILAAAMLTTMLSTGSTAFAQQATTPTVFSELAQPSADATPQAAYIRSVARSAYIWGWPMVNQMNRRAKITMAPKPGLLGGLIPIAPAGELGMLHDYIAPDERFVVCPNQDVVYGLGYYDLDTEPAVIQVPDFGERFWVYALYDQRSDQFGELGKPYGTKPGFYLMVGPKWDGKVPEGITGVVRSSTSLANAIPRIFQNDTAEDREAIQPLINQVVSYPLSKFDGKVKTIEWKTLPDIPNPEPQGDQETGWIIPEKFFDQFGDMLDMVPPLPGEEAMYAQYRWLIGLAEKNPDIKKLIAEEAVATEKEVIAPFFQWKHNGKPAGNGWNRSVNNAQWGVDYYDRTGTAKSNMFDNRPSETQYFYTDFDTSGAQLDGTKTYKITFPAGETPPVNGFWSLTLYNEHHFFHPNDLKRYSLGTKNETLKLNADGSLTLYAGAKSPGTEQETNWLPAPEGTFSLYIRAYWGKQAILDGSWQPPKIEVIN